MTDSIPAARSVNTPNSSSLQKIRALNDQFRKTGQGGIVTISMGLHQLGRPEVDAIMKHLAGEKGDKSVEPNSEHDMGEFDVGSRTISWEINYYNNDLDDESEDPANPDETKRFMTLLLSTEY